MILSKKCAGTFIWKSVSRFAREWPCLESIVLKTGNHFPPHSHNYLYSNFVLIKDSKLLDITEILEYYHLFISS